MIILPNDKLGGAEQYLKMVAREFLERGYLIDVFFLKKKTYNGWEDLRNDLVSFHYTNFERERLGFIPAMRNIYRKRRTYYSYTFTSHVHCTFLAGLLRKYGLIRTDKQIARESTSIFKRFTGYKLLFFKLLYKAGYGTVDLLICQTDYMKHQLTETLPRLENKVKIRTFANPVDLRQMVIKGNEPVIPYPVNGRYIVSAGRLIPEKGFDILLSAFAELKKRHTDLKLLILGEGPERVNLTRQTKDLKLGSDVFMPGHVENVYPYLKHAFMCVVSSRIEGFPNILLQMMAQNERVVSTLCAGGISEIKGLLTCNTEDPIKLSEIMDESIQMKVSPREDFDVELRKRSITEFVNRLIEESTL